MIRVDRAATQTNSSADLNFHYDGSGNNIILIIRVQGDSSGNYGYDDKRADDIYDEFNISEIDEVYANVYDVNINFLDSGSYSMLIYTPDSNQYKNIFCIYL